MASAPPVLRGTFNRAETDRRVRHPLEALRGLIRGYIIAEGTAVALIYLAILCWVGLLIDWGLFALYWFWNWIGQSTGVDLFRNLWCDWIRETDIMIGEDAAWNLRLVLLIVALLGLIAVVVWMVFTRLFKEFSDSALALVLERHFPQQLGDRLITAVELADPNLAQKYGYSQAMVDHTIKDAADRVETVLVSEVFNWRRLTIQWAVALGLTIGIYGLSLASAAGSAALAADASAARNLSDFHGTAFTWFKRNILLWQREYWLPQAYIEIVRFQSSPEDRDEMRVGRDEERPDVQARAYEWVIVDRSRRDGIRPLTFRDLIAQELVSKELAAIPLPSSWGGWIVDLDELDVSVPAGVVPLEWHGKKASYVRQQLQRPEIRRRIELAGALAAVEKLLNWQDWTIDRIFLQLDRTDVREPLRREHPHLLKKFEDLLAELEQLADLGPWGTIHRLTIPEGVTVTYRGQTTKSVSHAERRDDNRYFIGLAELKESVTFVVSGENYTTPPRRITLVPPPSLSFLTMNKWEPAYLYYRIQGDPRQLKGKRQQFRDLHISLTGEISTVLVPFGSDVELKAVADRDLQTNVRLLPPQRRKAKGSITPVVSVPVPPGQEFTRTFSIRFDSIVRPIEFEFHFNDRDNVKGKRHVVIEPVEDRPPQEEGNIELHAVLRKPRFRSDPSKTSEGSTLDGFLITPDALLPFRGSFRDDHALTKLEWLYEVEQVEFELAGTGSSLEEREKEKGPRLVLGGNANLRRLKMALSGLQFLPGHAGYPIMVPSYTLFLSRLIEFDIRETAKRGGVQEGTVPLQRFAEKLAALRESERDTLPSELARKLLDKAPRPPFITFHDLKQGQEEFDVRKHLPRLKVKDATKEPQLHHRLRLSVMATDNNIETGPATTHNKMPVTFLVVSEGELQIQILVEEEAIRERLEKAVDKLRAQKVSLEEQISKLTVPGPALSLVGLRLDEARKIVQDGYSVSREVYTDYSRILREMEINRIDEKKIKEVDSKICLPLEEVNNAAAGNFTMTEGAVTRLWEAIEADVAEFDRVMKEIDRLKEAKRDNEARDLELALKTRLENNRPGHLAQAREARDQMVRLIERLDGVLEAIGGVLDYGRVVARLVTIEQMQRQNYERLRIYHEDVVRRLLQELTGQ